MLSVIVVVYVGIALSVCTILFSTSKEFIEKLYDNSLLLFMLSCLIAFCGNFLYMGQNDFHDSVFKQYSDESDKQRILGNILVGAFVLGSFVLLVSIWFLFPVAQ